MIIVHHLEHSRSHRILWLLEEMGLDYEVKLYKRDPVTMLAPPELKAVHPLGKSPVITDGARTLAESGAISNISPTPTRKRGSRRRGAATPGSASSTGCISRKGPP